MTTSDDLRDLDRQIRRGRRARFTRLYLELEDLLDDRDGELSHEDAATFSRAYDALARLRRL